MTWQTDHAWGFGRVNNKHLLVYRLRSLRSKHSLQIRLERSTYGSLLINVVDAACPLGCLDDSGSLDGDSIAEPLTLAVYNARDEDVATHAVGLGSFYNTIVGGDGLWITALVTGIGGRAGFFFPTYLLPAP